LSPDLSRGSSMLIVVDLNVDDDGFKQNIEPF
jgi:hypothetical protein